MTDAGVLLAVAVGLPLLGVYAAFAVLHSRSFGLRPAWRTLLVPLATLLFLGAVSVPQFEGTAKRIWDHGQAEPE